MLSKEFITERGGDRQPETDAEYAARQAAGEKNLQGLKDFGSRISQGVQNFFKPAAPAAAAPDVPAANPMAQDPAQRAAAAAPDVPAASPMSQDPAQRAQAAAAAAPAASDEAPPPPGGEVRPVPTSTITATELPSGGMRNAAPTAMKGGYGSGANNPSLAPNVQGRAEPDADAAKAAAAADAGRQSVKSTETNPELERMKTNAGISSTADAKSDIKGAPSFAGQTDEFGGMESPPTATAPRTEKAINPETGQEYDKLATAQSANDGDAGEELAKIKANAGLAQSANDGDAGEAQAAAGGAPAANPMSQDPAQRAQAAAAAPESPAAAEPAPIAAAAPPAAPAPAAPAPAAGAASMAGSMRSTGQPAAAAKPAAKSDPAVLKQQQDLIAKGAKIKADGIMGPATQAAIKQFSAAPAASGTVASAGGGRGFVSPTAADTAATVAAAKPAAAPAKPTAVAAAKPAAAPAKPTAVAAAKPAAAPATAAAKLPAPQTGAAGQAARAASGKAPTQVAARQSTAAVMESQEINRMRFLAGLTKD